MGGDLSQYNGYLHVTTSNLLASRISLPDNYPALFNGNILYVVSDTLLALISPLKDIWKDICKIEVIDVEVEVARRAAREESGDG